MAFLATWQFWGILCIVLLLGEIASPGFVLGCVAIACIPPLLVGALWSPEMPFPLDGRITLAVFGVSALLGLLFIRPSVVKHLYGKGQRRSDVEGMVGSKALVVKEIPEGQTGGGYVKVRGSQWWAFSVDGKPVPVGTEVEILEVKGAKVIVTVAKGDD